MSRLPSLDYYDDNYDSVYDRDEDLEEFDSFDDDGDGVSELRFESGVMWDDDLAEHKRRR